MSRKALTAIAAVTLLSFTASASPATVATTRVLPGWPRVVGAGTVLPGPGGGVVVVSIGDPKPVNEIPFITTALRRDGRRLWVDHRVPGCGNCDDGAQPVALQPDGTYGPIGWEGSDVWALDAQGRELTGCSGAVAADGTCFAVRATFDSSFVPHPVMIAKRPDGGELWSVTDAGYRWLPDFDGPPVVVRDDTGLLYAGLGLGTDMPSGAARRGRLIAVDPATHGIVWTRPDVYQVLTTLGSGVLAARQNGVVSIGPDGAERWSRPVPLRDTVAPATTVYDAVRNRLYLGRSSGVTALVASTGIQAWRTRPADRAHLLSVGRSGRVYVSIDAAGRRGVRALRLADGSAAWGRRTRLPVLGALELADGSVAVSAGNRFAPTKADRLTLLRPR